VLGPAGLIATMIDLGWVAPDKAVRFGKGGRVNPAGPQITITQVRAEHSSEVTVTDPATKKTTTYPGGEPCGFIVEMENGFTIYHMGDMDPRDAAYATKEMLKRKFARVRRSAHSRGPGCGGRGLRASSASALGLPSGVARN